MILLPAIDIINGNPVRLYQGDYSKEEKINRSVSDIAMEFQDLGADYIHIVDLDGAKYGKPKNHQLIKSLAKTLKTPIEVGGGIRDIKTIENLLENGVSRVILGTVAISKKDLLKEALEKYREKIAVGVDCKNGFVSTDGWLKNSKINYLDFCKELENIGVKNIIFTDISKDGTLKGPNLEMLKKLKETVSVSITASGGIKDLEDIKALSELDLYGAITGKAIYSKTLDLKEGINILKY
ncbi:MAG: 1-(5-phosphoribosyl)-5-[(5-phosphoribosylamino)methylideneamino]imidazole-4-carboxamide isomerase [Clostridium perfringens]|nr:1-(5-phosphoribosyl)-5-[(5-phosphoribosylamino)methylideneamino]imidazole-4-carboxamide isomerase [Clostridium perfringens]